MLVGGRKKSRDATQKELLRQEAQRLQGLEGSALLAALGVSTWTAPRYHWVSIFLGFLTACGAVALMRSETAGEYVFSIVVTAIFGLLCAAFVFEGMNPGWVQLDSTGITLGGGGFPWRSPPPPRVYRWADCDPFVVRSNGIDEPLSVECELSQGSLRCPSWFGDADDVAVLLNAYRSVYGNAEAPSGPDDGGKQPSLRKLRRQEAERLQGLEGPALQAALGERTWRHSARHWWTVTAAMSVWAVPLAGFFAFALATDPCDRQAWVVSVPMIALGVAAISYPLLRALNPPWVRLDSTGITHGGPRFVRHSPPPRVCRWADCGPFAVRSHEAAVCELARGRFELDNKFGGLEDLVTILNAYRLVYGGTQVR